MSSGEYFIGDAPDSNANAGLQTMPKLEKVEITVMDHEIVKAETLDPEGARSSAMKPFGQSQSKKARASAEEEPNEMQEVAKMLRTIMAAQDQNKNEMQEVAKC